MMWWMRRFSEVSASQQSVASESDLAELDLRKDYRNAVECLVQCESIIVILEEKLAAKDERIAGLEDRIVRMSLELASTKASEDRLQHKLRMGVASSSMSSFALASTNEEGGDGERRPCGHPSRRTTIAHDDLSRYRPVSNRRKEAGGLVRDAAADADCAKTSFTTAATTSFTTAATTSFTSVSSRQGWNMDDSNTSRFGQFIKNCCGPKQQQQQGDGGTMHVHFPEQQQQVSSQNGGKTDIIDEKEEGEQTTANNGDNNDPFQLQRPRTRRAPNRKRTELQKSSRSFLEARGVVFPVSSFEVINKGCLERSTVDEGCLSKNEEWGAF